jgi:hypothetical protein
MNTTTQVQTVKVIFYDTLVSKNRSDCCLVELHGVGAFGLRTRTLLHHEPAARRRDGIARSIVNRAPETRLSEAKVACHGEPQRRACARRTSVPDTSRSNLVRGAAARHTTPPD